MDYLEKLDRLNRLEETIEKLERMNKRLNDGIICSIDNDKMKDDIYQLLAMVAEKAFFEGITSHGDIMKVDTAIVGAMMLSEINDNSVKDNLKQIVNKLKQDLRNSN